MYWIAKQSFIGYRITRVNPNKKVPEDEKLYVQQPGRLFRMDLQSEDVIDYEFSEFFKIQHEQQHWKSETGVPTQLYLDDRLYELNYMLREEIIRKTFPDWGKARGDAYTEMEQR